MEVTDKTRADVKVGIIGPISCVIMWLANFDPNHNTVLSQWNVGISFIAILMVYAVLSTLCPISSVVFCVVIVLVLFL